MMITDDPIEILEREAAAVAACFGVPAAADLAAALVERIALTLGGARLYLPSMRTRCIGRRDDEIRGRWRGNNLDELAREYSLSKRQIRRVVRRK